MMRPHAFAKASFEVGVVVDRLTDPAWGVVLEVVFADATRIQRIWPSPTIFAPANSGNNFLLSFQTEPGKTYTPQYVDSLSALNWQNLPSVAGDGTVKALTNSAPSVAQRFYRLIEQ